MTLQQLKEKIIKDETEFIVEMYEGSDSEPLMIKEIINEMISEVNSFQTPNDLIGYYTRRGFDESEAYNVLFGYLIEEV